VTRDRHGDGSNSRGFRYLVNDDQLARFGSASVAQRLTWLEEMREFTWSAATPETRERWLRLRRGDPIV
jgi:hypothetical protein